MTMLLICGIVYAQQVVNPAQTATSQAQLSVQQQAIFDANFDVRQQVNPMKWFLVGLCCHVYGFAFAVLDTPQVLPERLLGKSPDYITAYTAEYQRKARNKRIKGSCLGGGTLVVLIALVAPFIEINIITIGNY